ncbi:hypothetical protein EDC96DRAFT_263441 [Choanephora cucurbitarum]|nr:hypothetical protein EDC96DRAFT_263441 [Choanephora cucurbitarum]
MSSSIIVFLVLTNCVCIEYDWHCWVVSVLSKCLYYFVDELNSKIHIVEFATEHANRFFKWCDVYVLSENNLENRDSNRFLKEIYFKMKHRHWYNQGVLVDITNSATFLQIFDRQTTIGRTK